jgi:type VI protein secretion system component VasF
MSNGREFSNYQIMRERKNKAQIKTQVRKEIESIDKKVRKNGCG